MTRKSVDLPAPLGPNNAVTPGCTSKVISEIATTEPNHLDSRRTEMVGSLS
jgi:hypothetical protein